MDINLITTENGVELSHPPLPAPLVLTKETGLAFAAALISSDLKTPAFKTDKNVWAPQTREPLGLWVLEDGTIQIWLAGQAVTVTVDECAELALAVLSASAQFQIGQLVETVQDFTFYDDPSRTHPLGDGPDYDDSTSVPQGTILPVAEIVPLADGRLGYLVYSDDTKSFGLMMRGDGGDIRTPPPEQQFEVVFRGYRYFERSVTVTARTTDQARTLAKDVAKTLPAEAGWVAEDHPLRRPNNIGDVRVVAEGGDAEVNATEGWSQDETGEITAVAGGAFDGDNEAAFQFVLARALDGSRRHASAIRAYHAS